MYLKNDFGLGASGGQNCGGAGAMVAQVSSPVLLIPLSPPGERAGGREHFLLVPKLQLETSIIAKLSLSGKKRVPNHSLGTSFYVAGGNEAGRP